MSRLPRAVLFAALVGSAGNLIVYVVAAVMNLIPAEFTLLNPVTVVFASTAGAVGGGVALAVLSRLTERAVLIFRIAGVVATLISLAGPLRAGAGTAGGISVLPALPQVEPPMVVALIVMHLVAAVTVIIVLTVRGVEPSN